MHETCMEVRDSQNRRVAQDKGEYDRAAQVRDVPVSAGEYEVKVFICGDHDCPSLLGRISMELTHTN